MNSKKNGFTLIELMVVMAIMAILSTICIYLINGSCSFYKGVHQDYDGQSEARIAIAYVTNKLRENDVERAMILYDNDPEKIRIEGESIGSYRKIVFQNKKLVEKTYEENAKGKAVKTREVVIGNIESFEIEGDSENNVTITVSYLGKNNERHTFKQVVSLRCKVRHIK